MTSATGEKPANEPISRSARLALIGIAATLFMATVDERVVVTAMPRIISDLGGFREFTAVFTAFMIAATIAIPVFGRLSDLHGRKVWMLVAIALFTLGSALCGSAQTLLQLVVFRALQGAGAGASEALAFTAVADLLPPDRRAKATGAFSAIYGIAGVLGPPLGGIMTDGLGWRSVFLLSVPLGLCSGVVLAFSFPRHRPRPADERTPFDAVGSLSLIGWVAPLIVALSWGGSAYPWVSLPVLGLLGVSAVVLAAFVWRQVRSEDALIPLHLFRNKSLLAILLVIPWFVVGGFCPLMFVPMFLQGVAGTSATRSGLLLTPMIGAMMLSSTAAGQLINRLGARALAVASMVVIALCLGFLTHLNVHTNPFWVSAIMVGLGVGLGATMPVFMSAAQNSVPESSVGSATSLLQFVQVISSAVGLAVMGTLLNAFFPRAFQSSLPASARQQIGEELTRKLAENPQSLLDSDGATQLADMFSSAGVATLAPVVNDSMRLGLATALTQVFTVAFVLVVIAAGLAFRIRTPNSGTSGKRA